MKPIKKKPVGRPKLPKAKAKAVYSPCFRVSEEQIKHAGGRRIFNQTVRNMVNAYIKSLEPVKSSFDSQ